jgi:hypothetical protein
MVAIDQLPARRYVVQLVDQVLGVIAFIGPKLMRIGGPRSMEPPLAV